MLFAKLEYFTTLGAILSHFVFLYSTVIPEVGRWNLDVYFLEFNL